MDRLLYFAYGSNMLKARLEYRVGQVEKISNYTLHGYSLVFNAGMNCYANIIPSTGGSVEGVLYKLSEYQIRTLDQYEGHPVCYQKFYKINGNDIIFGYWATGEFKLREGKPSIDYLNLLIKGAKENELNSTYLNLTAYKDIHYRLKKRTFKNLFKRT